MANWWPASSALSSNQVTAMDPDGLQIIFPGEGSEAPGQLALLGPWRPGSDTEAFTIGGEQPGVVWRANLPEDPLESALALDSSALALRRIGQALATAGPLLVEDLRLMAGTGPSGLAYELPAGAAPDRREILLQVLTRETETPSFSLRDDITGAVELVSRFTSQLRRLVEQFALVESRYSDRCVARTRVDWSGDVHTWWAPGIRASMISDHRRVLAQAMATRREWLRLVFVLTSGAAKISVVMATTPFNPLAIWAAWAYVKKVVEQYNSLEQT